MPDSADIRTEVVNDLSQASGTPVTQIADDTKLKDLGISDENLVTLALNLRIFIRQANHSQTFVKSEIDLNAMKVSDLINLVSRKVNP